MRLCIAAMISCISSPPIGPMQQPPMISPPTGLASNFAKDGFVKLLANPVGGEIIGGCCIGPMGGELIHEIIAAMHKRMTVHELAAMPHYHPTLAEIWTYPAEELAGKIPLTKAGR